MSELLKLLGGFLKVCTLWYMNQGLVRKIVFGYFILIFVPTLAIGIVFFNVLNKDNIEAFTLNHNAVLEQVKSELNMNVFQVESVYKLLQSNTDVVDLLSGNYSNAGDQVYIYRKQVQQLFSYAKLTNKYIESIVIYKNNNKILSMGSDIREIDQLKNHIFLSSNLNGVKGIWRFDADIKNRPLFIYYQKMYNADFSREIGILEVTVSESFITQPFLILNTNNSTNIYYYEKSSSQSDIKKEAFALPEEIFYDIQNRSKGNIIPGLYYRSPKLKAVVNRIDMNDLGFYAIVITNVGRIFKIDSQTKFFIFMMLPLLLISLSSIYYFMFSYFSKLLKNLAKHIKTNGKESISEFHEKVFGDEIGILVDSYNEMVRRIKELIANIHKAQEQQKEAEFLALQSQINPHFIYNSLESIRMMAETGESQKVADMTYMMGRLMRYSLSKKATNITLQVEIDHVMNYLSIHKIRMGDRLEYQIHSNIDLSIVSCPKFILQPLVENCIVHGISVLRRKGIVCIDVEETDEYVIIKIADNGAGIDESRLASIQMVLKGAEEEINTIGGGGIGISNVNKRIRAFFGSSSGINIHSVEKQGTTYIIHLSKEGGLIHETYDR